MAGRRDLKAGSAYVRLYLRDLLTRKIGPVVANAGAKLQAVGQSAKAAGRSMAMAATAMLAPLALATKTFADFEDQMLSVKAVTGASAKAYAMLTERAKELGRTTSFTASQVAAGMTELGRAGFDPSEIDAATESMLALARATGTELSQAAEIAAGTLRGFNMQAGEADRVADVLVATANNSAQTLEELGDTMAYAAPIAAEFGLSIEQTSKAIGVLANMGIKGSMAGTQLRRIMLSLADPAVQTLLRKNMVDPIDQATGEFRDLGDIMLDIGKVMSNMSGPERLAFGKELFDMRAVGGGMKLATQQFEDLEHGIDNAEGAAQRTADVMDSGLGGALRELWSAIEGIKLSIGGSLAPVISGFAEVLAGASRSVATFVQENKGTVLAVAALATGLAAGSAALMAFGVAAVGLGVTLAAIGTAISAIGTVIGFVLTPIGAIIAAITVAAGLLVAEFAAMAASSLFDMAKSGSFKNLGSDLLGMAASFKKAMKGVVDAVQANDLEGAFEIMSKEAELQWLTMLETLEKHWDEFRNRMAIKAKGWALDKMKDAAFGGKWKRRTVEWVAGKITGEGDEPEQEEEHRWQKIDRLRKEQEERLARQANQRREKSRREAILEGGMRRRPGSGDNIEASLANLRQLDQELARVNQKYETMLSGPDISPAEVRKAETARQLEIAAVRDQFRRQEKQEQLRLADQVKTAQIRATKAGSTERQALLEQQRQVALRDATTEEQKQAINERYDILERERKEATEQQLQDQIGRLKIQVELEGIDEQLALLEQEEKKALRGARPDETELIKQRFALERKLLNQQSFASAVAPTRTTTSAAAAVHMGTGGAMTAEQKRERQLQKIGELMTKWGVTVDNITDLVRKLEPLLRYA